MLYRIKEFFSRITRPFKRSFDWLMHNNPNKRYLVLIEVV